MRIDLTITQEQELRRLAERNGRTLEKVLLDAVDQLLERKRFQDAVQVGLAQLDRGEYLTHEEVGIRLERLFASQRRPSDS